MQSPITYLKMPDLFNVLEAYREEGFFAMIDRKVFVHLPDWIRTSSRVFWLDEPEAQKNLDTFAKACSFFLRSGVDRKSTLLAIGGGATTDLAGFVAASLLRGIAWVSIPTTLLAMVDGAIGGKVAVNTVEGKNLIGAFHAPAEVLICDEFLTTLPTDEWISGYGEVIKYGFLSEKIHQLIMGRSEPSLIAWECALHKQGVVERDFKEQGERILLNLGHTLGHAFEFSLKITHGQSVILGMHFLFRLLDLKDRQRELLAMMQALAVSEAILDLSRYDFDLESFLNYINQDKKRASGKVRLIIPKAIGDCQIQEISLQDLIDRIKGHNDFKN